MNLSTYKVWDDMKIEEQVIFHSRGDQGIYKIESRISQKIYFVIALIVYSPTLYVCTIARI